LKKFSLAGGNKQGRKVPGKGEETLLLGKEGPFLSGKGLSISKHGRKQHKRKGRLHPKKEKSIDRQEI